MWIAPALTSGAYDPGFETLQPTSVSLLALSLDDFLFRKLPSILSRARADVKWHYNPVCRGCPFETECSTHATLDGELGAMPNISLQDATLLQNFLKLAREMQAVDDEAAEVDASEWMTDIEDLDQVSRAKGLMQQLQESHPSTVRRAKRVLRLPERAGRGRRSPDGDLGSPVIESVLTNSVQVRDGATLVPSL